MPNLFLLEPLSGVYVNENNVVHIMVSVQPEAALRHFFDGSYLNQLTIYNQHLNLIYDFFTKCSL